MVDGGWVVDATEPNLPPTTLAKCGAPDTFRGFKKNAAVGYVEATFKGNGVGYVSFTNCNNSGMTKVYMNGIEIGVAYSWQPKFVNFNYKRGDTLKITEEKSGIIKINTAIIKNGPLL